MVRRPPPPPPPRASCGLVHLSLTPLSPGASPLDWLKGKFAPEQVAESETMSESIQALTGDTMDAFLSEADGRLCIVDFYTAVRLPPDEAPAFSSPPRMRRQTPVSQRP